jgi:hypothetical protein
LANGSFGEEDFVRCCETVDSHLAKCASGGLPHRWRGKFSIDMAVAAPIW